MPPNKNILYRLIATSIPIEKTALQDRKNVLSYRTLIECVKSLAVELDKRRITSADRVGLLVRNRVECVVAALSVDYCDSTFLLVNSQLAGQRAWDLFDRSQVNHVIVCSLPREDKAPKNWSFETICCAGMEFHLASRISRLDVKNQMLQNTDKIAAVVFTSGSTGIAKGVMLCRDNLVFGAKSVTSYVDLDANDNQLVVLPISFDAGFNQVLSALASGGCATLIDYLFPNDIAAACKQFDITGLTAVPPLFSRMLRAKWDEQTRNRVRFFAGTGGEFHKILLGRVRGLFPRAEPFVMYGLTEAFRSTYLPPQDVDRKQGSVGIAIPHASVRVLDKDGKDCAPYESGEIVQTGPLVGQGYLDSHASSGEAGARFGETDNPEGGKERCVFTGDFGYFDDDGYLYFVGRKDGVLKIDGHRVHLQTIESVISSHHTIDECVVLKTTDGDSLSDKMIAAIVVAGGQNLCERSLADHLVSKGIEARFQPSEYHVLKSFHRDLNGKIDRHAVLELIKSP